MIIVITLSLIAIAYFVLLYSTHSMHFNDTIEESIENDDKFEQYLYTLYNIELVDNIIYTYDEQDKCYNELKTMCQ